MPSCRLGPLIPLVLLALTACGDGAGPSDGVAIAQVIVYSEDPTVGPAMLVGGTHQLKVELRDSTNQILPPRTTAWRSSDPGIAEVTSSGLVTGISTGLATISATVAGKAGTYPVSVLPLASSLDIQPSRIGLVPGGRFLLKVIFRDESGGELPPFARPVTWANSDPTVASITGDYEAVPLGIAPGTTTLTATGGGASGSATVDVSTVAFATIFAGFRHSCGITAARVAYCWGANIYNVLAAPVGGGSGTPLRTEGLGSVAQIVTAAAHACARTVAGDSYCWGSPSYGKLGDGTDDPSVSSVPTPQKTLGGLTFSDLTVGEAHSCGIANSRAYCWGAGLDGQLGNGGTALSTATPAAVSGDLTFTTIRSNPVARTTCALAVGGQAYCWGRNGEGQVGDSTTDMRVVPTAVAGGLAFASIVVGDRHACALTAGGSAYCWGANEQRQLGHPGTGLTPGPVDGGLTFTSLSAGTAYTCGIDTSGQAWCWGANDQGQLGDGTMTPSAEPVQVSGGLTFSQISAGGDHTCGLTDASIAYCWGSPEAMGSSANVASPVPVKVAGQP